jgi:cell division protein FtsZ
MAPRHRDPREGDPSASDSTFASDTVRPASGADRAWAGIRGAEAAESGPGSTLELLEIGPDDGGDDLLEFESPSKLQAVIKVVGVGGGGGNALNTMIAGGLSGVEFIAANTDNQALQHSLAPLRLQLGSEVTRGLGCGANPEKGREAALEARDRIRELLIGADMVFVTAGLGGGTGTGAAPIIAEVAREVGALTVAVVTKPFTFEGKPRSKHAERGLDELHRVVDTLITIPNQRLLAVAGKNARMRDAFRLADDVLLGAVRGISDLITGHGLINLDFNDVRTIMNEMGMALMGTGVGRGESRAVEAARSAISNPLLEDLSMQGARGVLINFTGGPDMTLFEVEEAAKLIQDASHEDANIIFGAVIDDRMEQAGEMRVTVIATGLDDGRVGRGRDRERDREERDFVPHLRPIRRDEAARAPAPLAAEPVVEAAVAVEVEDWSGEIPPPAPRDESFASPFDDEFDTPAFIRKRAGRSEPAPDRETPAFLRRSAD